MNKQNIVIGFSYIIGYFVLLLLIARELRYDWIAAVVQWQPSRDIVGSTRILYAMLMDITYRYPDTMFFVFTFITAIDAYILQLLLEKWQIKEFRFFAIMFLFSPAVFYGFLPYYYVGSLQESVIYLGMFLSLLIYEDHPKSAIYLQFIFMWIKEFIPLIIITMYFIDKKDSVNEVLQSIKNKLHTRFILIIGLIAILYMAVRLYFSLTLSNTLYANPFTAGSISLLWGVPPDNCGYFGMEWVAWRVFLAYNIFWIFIVVLFIKTNRHQLYLFTVFIVVFVSFGYIAETTKWILMLPFVIKLFVQSIEFFKKHIDHILCNPSKYSHLPRVKNT
jgi:hypothetical protein